MTRRASVSDGPAGTMPCPLAADRRSGVRPAPHRTCALCAKGARHVSIDSQAPSADTPNSITRDDVAKVAALARLELTEPELETFTHQLADILDHAADLSALDLDGVEPLGTPVALENVLRADEPGTTLDRDEVLASAPAAESPSSVSSGSSLRAAPPRRCARRGT